MRYIQKGPEPEELANYRNNEPKDLPHSMNSLPSNVKKAMYASLLKEQLHICCYCESKLENDNYHVEHVRPQCLADVDPLDYSNLACSCNGDTNKPHCGHKKGNSTISITPYDTDCQNRFIYTADGQILPVEGDNEAANIIELLALNNDGLKAKRCAVLLTYDESILGTGSVKENMEEDMKPNNGELNPYISMIEYHYHAGTFFD